MRKYYEENPLKLHQMRLRKRKKKMESPYDKYSDHLQRLMAFAPHRTENMVRLIQTTYRGYGISNLPRSNYTSQRNAVAIQGWYRTMVSLYWRHGITELEPLKNTNAVDKHTLSLQFCERMH